MIKITLIDGDVKEFDGDYTQCHGDSYSVWKVVKYQDFRYRRVRTFGWKTIKVPIDSTREEFAFSAPKEMVKYMEVL